MLSSSVNKSDNTTEQYLKMISNNLVEECSLPDKYHLGKRMLKAFKEYPNRIMQIDKLTGESESVQSFHNRTVRAALMMRARGLHTGDVVGILGPNHLDMAVPFIACLYDGLSACSMDELWKYESLDTSLKITRPKLIFCQNARVGDIQKVITTYDIDCEIITFDDNKSGYDTIRDFLQSLKDDNEINSFEPANFDTSDTIATIMSTSGSSGIPKGVCVTHKALVHQMGLLMSIVRHAGGDRSCVVLLSPQWTLGAFTVIISCLFAFTRIQMSDAEHTLKQIMELIHDYKPKWCFLTTSLANMLLRDSERYNFDLTSLDVILIAGSPATAEFLKDLEAYYEFVFDPINLAMKSQRDVTLPFIGNVTSQEILILSKVKGTCSYQAKLIWLIMQLIKGRVYNAYGLTETCGSTFSFTDHGIVSCGTSAPGFEYKIVDVNSGMENGPNVPGELWIKAPTLFKGYYGKPELTKEIFSEDGFLKTGDLLYKDENDNYFYIDRIKMMLKYRMHQISPVKIENVIKQHPGVKEVGVIGLTHYLYDDLATACIVRTAPNSVTEDEIHDLVRKNLPPTHYLRGGILFMDKLMMTLTHKIDRKKLKQIAEKCIDLTTLKLDE